jgi:hypothetical protein
VPRGTQDPHRASCRFAYRTLTVCGRPFQSILLQHSVPRLGPTTPTLEQKRQEKGKAKGKEKHSSFPLLLFYTYACTCLFRSRVGLGSSPFARRY